MDYLQFLIKNDDPTYWEHPPNFDYRASLVKFECFAKDLSQLIDTPLKSESGTNIQDASFHSQIYLPLPDGHHALIRFSNFGNMTTISEDEPLPEDTLNRLKALFDKHGYIYVPATVLDQPYSGCNPGVRGIDTWWIRYFDWV